MGAILIIVLIVQMNRQKQAGTTATPATGVSTTETASSSAPTTQTGTGTKGNAAYNAALAIYQKNGYRIQFSQCHGTPGHLVIPEGNKYMLDNRDNAAHTIKVGPYTYKLGAYGFVVAKATNLGINNVTCDGGGAAQINIEK